MTGQEIINDIALKMYKKPLSNVRQLPTWPSLDDPLHAAMLLIDFDTEVSMNGLLGFLENSSGAYLDQTIEAFRTFGAGRTADVLCRVRATMQTHGVSHRSLREPHHHTKEYQITSFAELHGPSVKDFAAEVCRLGRSLYIYDKSQESPWPPIEDYLEKDADRIRAELQRIGA